MSERSPVEAIAAALDVEVVSAAALGGGDTGPAWRVALADGDVVLAKERPPGAPAQLLTAEAVGLRWLAAATEDGGPHVPEVRHVDPDLLVMGWIEHGAAGDDADLGRAVAALHRTGAPAFATPPGTSDGCVGPLPLPGGPWPDGVTLWVEGLVLPFLRAAVDRGAIEPGGAAVVEAVGTRAGELLGPPEPPARVHGDLWVGNVLAGTDGRWWVVDAGAAHGGWREADLAMLALFGGLPTACLAAYDEAHPLADGWEERVALHQIHPLLVHAALFGGGYGRRAVTVARSYR